MPRRPSDAKKVRDVLKRLTTAIGDKDAAGMIALLARDEVTFDLAPPLRMSPRETHDPQRLAEWFATWKSRIVSRSRELKIEVSGDLAYAYALQHMTGTKVDGEKVDLWFRVTACFRRERTAWRITHMHNSVPFAMDGSGKALLDLRPSARRRSAARR